MYFKQYKSPDVIVSVRGLYLRNSWRIIVYHNYERLQMDNIKIAIISKQKLGKHLKWIMKKMLENKFEI